MHRRTLLLLSGVGIVLQACAKRRPRTVHLYFLPNGHVRLDDGPELDMVQLRAAVGQLKLENPRPDIALMPTTTAKYDDVARTLAIFQEEQYGAHLGFIGMERPER